MLNIIINVCFISFSFFCLIVYNLNAYSYSCSILQASPRRKANLVYSLCINILLITVILFLRFSILFTFLLVFLLILLEFLFFFKDRLITSIFASGIFIFHIMNTYMLIFGLISLLNDISSLEEMREKGLYPALVFLVLLVLIISLEIFKKIVVKDVIQILLKNIRQLYFVTTSLILINIYLCILSVSYENIPYSSMLFFFFLSTSILLYGAFYTSFNHAVRMSVLMEYEIRSKDLEQQLEESNRNVGRYQSIAFTDPLTGVRNRRYGLRKLDQFLEGKVNFSLCFIDLDHLKEVNDKYGHNEGDKYILYTIKMLASAFPLKDICRLGGDEFLIFLPNKDEVSSIEEMRKINASIEGSASSSGLQFAPSISYGIIEISSSTVLTSLEILEIADKKMYALKQAKKRYI